MSDTLRRRAIIVGEALTMGEYFRPWRRRFGLLTLVMACVAFGGWARSMTFCDSVDLPSRLTPTFMPVHVVSLGRCVGMFFPEARIDNKRLLPWFRTNEGIGNCNLLQQPHVEWKWRFCGFGIGWAKAEGFWHVVIPYWFVITPLTLLSVYVLLSKPRKSIQNEIVEPISEKAV